MQLALRKWTIDFRTVAVQSHRAQVRGHGQVLYDAGGGVGVGLDGQQLDSVRVDGEGGVLGAAGEHLAGSGETADGDQLTEGT